MCVCFFLSSSPPLSFDFMFSPFFSKVIQLHAEQRGEKITVLRNKSARHVIKDNVPFVTFYSSVFFSPTHFHLALLHVWQYLIISVILLLRRKKKSDSFLCMLFFMSSSCVWQTHHLGTEGNRATRCLLLRPLILPPQRGSGNTKRTAEIHHRVSNTTNAETCY